MGSYSDHHHKTPKKIRDYFEHHDPDLFNLLEQHRSAKALQGDIEWADLILYMDKGNLKRLEDNYAGAIPKSRCLGDWTGESRIEDPMFLLKGKELDALLDRLHQTGMKLVRWLIEK